MFSHVNHQAGRAEAGVFLPSDERRQELMGERGSVPVFLRSEATFMPRLRCPRMPPRLDATETGRNQRTYRLSGG